MAERVNKKKKKQMSVRLEGYAKATGRARKAPGKCSTSWSADRRAVIADAAAGSAKAKKKVKAAARVAGAAASASASANDDGAKSKSCVVM